MQVAAKPSAALAAQPCPRRMGLCSGLRHRQQPVFGVARQQQRAAHARVQAQAQQVTAGKDEKRWDAQVVEGKVRNVCGADLCQHLADGWVLLDVRPPSETKKARVKGAVEVPIFVADESMSPSSLVKRLSAFGTGGWWLGGTHMVANQDFLAEVQAKIPKDARLIVGCQKGLRSLAACEQLSLAGYQTLAWINGGFDSCKKGEVPTVGDVDVRYAGIGGLSEVIGWTEVQQEQNKGLGSVDGALKLVGIILVLDLLLFAGEYVHAYLNGSL